MAVRKPIPLHLMTETDKLVIVDALLNEPWSPVPLKSIHLLTNEHKLELFDKLVESGAITYEGYPPPHNADLQKQPQAEHNALSSGAILEAAPHAEVERLLAIKEKYPDTPMEMLPEHIQVEVHEMMQTIMANAYAVHQTPRRHDDLYVRQDRHGAPVSDVIDYLVKHGHTDDRVTKFAHGYLQNLESLISKIRQDDDLILSYTPIRHTPNDIYQGRALLNGVLYRAMVARSEDVLIPPLALYVLSVSQRDDSLEILVPYIERRPPSLYFERFRKEAAVFGDPYFISEEFTAKFIASREKSKAAVAMVNMITELRHTMHMLAEYPISGEAEQCDSTETLSNVVASQGEHAVSEKDPDIELAKVRRAIFKTAISTATLDGGATTFARELYASNRATHPDLWPSVLAGELAGAYARAGQLDSALKLFGEEVMKMMATSEDTEFQERVSGLSQIHNIWTLLEQGKNILMEAHQDEEDVRQYLFELMVGASYGGIIGDYCRRLYEEMGSMPPRAAVTYGYAAHFKPDDAFSLFQNSYKTLAEIYEDKELQEASLVFNEIADVWERHAEVRKIAEKYRDTHLRGMLLNVIAFACAEAILSYSTSGKRQEARAVYYDLKQMVETHREQWPEMEEWLAKGTGNLIYMLVNADRPDEARTVYEDLRRLAKQYAGDKPKLLEQAGCRASQIIYAYVKANRRKEAREVYDELKKLTEDHSDKRKLLEWQATGAFDLSYGHHKAGESDEARKLFAEIRELMKSEAVLDALKQQKIDGIPKIEWLTRHLGEKSASA